MISRIIAIGIVSLIHVGCGVVNNPFKPDTVLMYDACGFDFEQTVELERVRFTPSGYWSNLAPCQSVLVSHDTNRDGWRVSVMGGFNYSEVIGVTEVAHFGIGSDIHLIGKPLVTPEEWLASRQIEWSKRQESHDYVERDITRIRHGSLDCWRIASNSYKRNAEVEVTDEKTHSGVGYACWEIDNDRYHHIGFSAGFYYKNGKPLYDIDIDEVLVRPVLESIELKEISAAAYEKRLAETRQRERDRCNRLVKGAWESGTRNIDDHYKRLIRECGYDPNTLKRLDQ